jgi:hypothetical protein
LTIVHVLVKVLQTSVDDEKSFGVTSGAWQSAVMSVD